MEIRPETPADEAAIRTLITSAFLDAEHSDGNEAAIVDRLRQANSLTVSLLAFDDVRIVGHVAFSPVAIDGQKIGWFGLGPVAVMPDRQKSGIGRALIDAGLDALKAEGAAGCVVLGDPAYYSRFGFVVDPNLSLAGVPPQYFQSLSFNGGTQSGGVSYHPAFGGD